jgi:hypothetical protein
MNGNGADRRRRAQRWYRLIVRLYPAQHRRAFGEQMVQAFGDHYRDAVGSGRVSRCGFWRSVLADAVASLVSEYVAAVRAGGGRVRRRFRSTRSTSSPHRRRVSPGRWGTRRGPRTCQGVAAGQGGGVDRFGRVRRRLRHRRSACRPMRVVASTRRHRLVYRGRVSALVLLAVLVGAALAAGTVLGHAGIAAVVAGVVAVAWLAYRIRLTRLVPAGPGGDWPAPPGGAGVREPRRPLPLSPAGSAARPRRDQQPSGGCGPAG